MASAIAPGRLAGKGAACDGKHSLQAHNAAAVCSIPDILQFFELAGNAGMPPLSGLPAFR
jgi:hypothetical protein